MPPVFKKEEPEGRQRRRPAPDGTEDPEADRGPQKSNTGVLLSAGNDKSQVKSSELALGPGGGDPLPSLSSALSLLLPGFGQALAEENLQSCV